jgi:hypothetical protein
MPGQIQMEMIPVESIGIRTQHRRKGPAGAFVHRTQECPFGHVAAPTGQDRYPAPIG